MSKKTIVIGLILALFVIIGCSYVYFNNSKVKYNADTILPSISVQTSKNIYGANETITASILINGSGQRFTTFKANVALSNLTVESFTVGPNVTQWVKTPSLTSLDFFGGVYGDIDQITVYTLTLKPTGTGSASISLTNGAVFQTDGMTVTNILGTVENGLFTIEGLPEVSAGSNLVGYPEISYALNGSATGTNTISWSKVSGPGNVTFVSGATTLTPTLKADLPGTYVIKINAINGSAQENQATMQFLVYKSGDINNDTFVNDDDFTILLYAWSNKSRNVMADFNNDGQVNGSDFTILMINWPAST